MSTHHIVVNRPYPACILKITHPLRQVKIHQSDVAETIKQNAPHYMSVVKQERKAA